MPAHPIEADLDAAVACLRRGEVVAVATDTVFGLVCDPRDEAAVDLVYELKRRPVDLELTVLAAAAADLDGLVRWSGAAHRLAALHWPGPLSLVLPVGDRRLAVPRFGATLSVRVPNHPGLLELLRRTGPLASTSANRHGSAPAQRAADVRADFGADVAVVLGGDGRPGAMASTIIDCSVTPPRVLREGPIDGQAALAQDRRAGAIVPRTEEVDERMAVQQQGAGVDIGFTAKPALRATDPDVAALMDEELTRQEETLELIPSENLASVAVLEALGSWLNNKYAEGVPGKRYYGGCQVVDKVENLARDRCRELFGADHANVQPHSGSQANMAVYASVLKPGDTVLGMALDQGGHLTHGSPVNFSGKIYNFEAYTVSDASGRIDYDEVRGRAHEVAPAMIVAGYSSYPRRLDFAAFEDIARDVGALLMVDMAHFAGLVAGGAHPSPVPHADFVTFTTHKTMRGPWGGVVMCRAEHADAIDKSVCPGIQGGPQLHAIAAKAVMFKQCMQPEFRIYAQTVVSNAKALASGLTSRGVQLTTGGTDNHLMVIDLRPYGLRGRAVQNAFDEVGVTVNANAFPGHGGTPYNPNGIRLGTPSVTSRGMGETEMEEIADLVAVMLNNFEDEATRTGVRERSRALCRRFPLPYRP